jgi:V-type H+-transporting ATPase subunit a
MIPAESAHDTIAALGDLGLLQFKDLNTDKSAFQRSYANQVRARPSSQPLERAQEVTHDRIFAPAPSLQSAATTSRTQVKRCDELARRLRFFKDQVAKANVATTTPAAGDVDKNSHFDEIEVRLACTAHQSHEMPLVPFVCANLPCMLNHAR